MQTVYQNILARYCELLLTLGGAEEEEENIGGTEEEVEAALKACEDSSQLQRDVSLETLLISGMNESDTTW